MADEELNSFSYIPTKLYFLAVEVNALLYALDELMRVVSVTSGLLGGPFERISDAEEKNYTVESSH